jgi:hypothetical protein
MHKNGMMTDTEQASDISKHLLLFTCASTDKKLYTQAQPKACIPIAYRQRLPILLAAGPLGHVQPQAKNN